MSSGDLGFLAGAIPGLTLLLRNMLRFRRDIGQAESLARENGEHLDFLGSATSTYDFLFRPKAFVEASDGIGVRRAKEHLLTVRRRTLVRHVAGGGVMMVGALIGTFAATGFWPER